MNPAKGERCAAEQFAASHRVGRSPRVPSIRCVLLMRFGRLARRD